MGTLSTAARNATNDGNSSLYNSGTLELLDVSDNILASFALSATAWGAAASGVKTLADLPLTTTGTAAASTGTTITAARFRTSGSADIESALTVTLAAGGGQVIVDNLTVAENQTVNVTGCTVTISATTTA